MSKQTEANRNRFLNSLQNLCYKHGFDYELNGSSIYICIGSKREDDEDE